MKKSYIILTLLFIFCIKGSFATNTPEEESQKVYNILVVEMGNLLHNWEYLWRHNARVNITMYSGLFRKYLVNLKSAEDKSFNDLKALREANTNPQLIAKGIEDANNLGPQYNRSKVPNFIMVGLLRAQNNHYLTESYQAFANRRKLLGMLLKRGSCYQELKPHLNLLNQTFSLLNLHYNFTNMGFNHTYDLLRIKDHYKNIFDGGNHDILQVYLFLVSKVDEYNQLLELVLHKNSMLINHNKKILGI